MDSLQIAYPEWTGAPRKRGLDPLGMQFSSEQLYQKLLPGISNVTNRIRYYGFYSWLALHYARKVGDMDPARWKRTIRRAEALYALVSHAGADKAGIAGTQWAQNFYDQTSGDRLEFSLGADPDSTYPYLQQPMGVFGAAYSSQLREVGIFERVSDHDIPVASVELGEVLAAAYEEAIGSASAPFLRAIESGWVSRARLPEFAAMLPSAIALDSAERIFYERLLFARFDSAEPADIGRRRTLALLLSIAGQLNEAPDPNGVRWGLYAEQSFEGQPLGWPNAELERHASRWRAYQANDLSHLCFETLLKFQLDHLENHPRGVPLEQLVDECVQLIAQSARQEISSWGAFVDGIELEENAAGESEHSEASLSDRVLETRDAGFLCTPSLAWDALRLLAILQRKFEASREVVQMEFAHLNPMSARSLWSEMAFLIDKRKTSFVESVRLILNERVMRRHVWVAAQKLRTQNDYTFLFDADDGKVRLRDKDGPVQTVPRLAQALAFLRDIHLLDADGLTPLGQAALESA
ncbi:MAG: hypothetical protein ABI885_25665 [Gammaproteobacteria bacterium]